MMEVKKVAEEWEILNKEKKVAKSEKEIKNLVSQVSQINLYLWKESK